MINNNNIKYGALKVGARFVDSGKFEPSRIYILIDLTSSVRSAITKFSYEEWMKLLNDTTTDWAANLCLYNIFKRDAEVFSLWKTRDEWVKFGNFRKNEIRYWRDNLAQLLEQPLPQPPLNF